MHYIKPSRSGYVAGEDSAWRDGPVLISSLMSTRWLGNHEELKANLLHFSYRRPESSMAAVCTLMQHKTFL